MKKRKKRAAARKPAGPPGSTASPAKSYPQPNGDALAAARRRMPWMKIEKSYTFEGPQGRASLLDLFEERTQLVLYHYMFGPTVGGSPDIQHLRERYGWNRWLWYSGTAQFNRDLDVSDESGNSFGLNVFCRDGQDVYRTHFLARPGIEAFGTSWSFFDVTPLGRQENWQDAPAGTPQGEPYVWWRRHGDYDADAVGNTHCQKRDSTTP